MEQSTHNKLVSFIWSIADDCLRDVYVRGKYRDVILPMVVLRRLDTLLETTKDAVLEEVHLQKNELGVTELIEADLQAASGYVFYNTSKWTLNKICETAVNNEALLLDNMEEYLNGFSENVKEIIRCFDLEAQIKHMARKHVLLDVLEKFTSPLINLTPNEATDPDGRKLPALSNLGMGYVFEELIRKFNEENNEEAGEHFTPREVIELMTHLVFDPIKSTLPLQIHVYDPACGSGGMLTEAQNFIEQKYPVEDGSRDIYLYGKEINDETYAICKSDMMIKGNDPQNIREGSTLATDEFSGIRFDFMLSNPPYGKSWASDLKAIKDGSDIIDPRFQVFLNDYWGNRNAEDATPRSSDGQLLFLMEMVDKMKKAAAQGGSADSLGARIASVHNGSSLFTGDAGGGESNIRRFIIENDMLEAIIQLPNNLFYNTGIITYIWLLSNNKAENRKGKVQLIDASQLYSKLRKNLGNKNCKFDPEHIAQITKNYLTLAAVERNEESKQLLAAKVFDNSDFGYYKVTIERPDRRKAQFTADRIASLRFDKTLREAMEWIYSEWSDAVYEQETVASHEQEIVDWCEKNELNLTTKNRKKLLDLNTWIKARRLFDIASGLMDTVGGETYDDFNLFRKQVDKQLKDDKTKLAAAEKNAILNAVSWYDENAAKVIGKTIKLAGKDLDSLLNHLSCTKEQLPDFGYYPTDKADEYYLYETSTDLRDSESIPLKESIHDYFLAEVKPHVDEAWINLNSTKIGYEISFNKYFYQHKPLRSMTEVGADIIALEQQAEGLIAEILGIDVAAVSGVEA